MFVLMVALTIVSVPAVANMLVNGDFETGDLTGWTAFQSPWSAPAPIIEVQGAVVCHDAFTLHLRAANSSFGVWQAIKTVPGKKYQIDVCWLGNSQALFWNEVLLFNDDGRDIYDQLDAPAASSVLSKVDGWGMNPPAIFDCKSPFDGSQWFPGGPHTNVITATGTTMYVGLKAGTVAGFDGAVELYFDDVSVIPEPGSLLALVSGIGALGFVIRRRK
jgi:hypothetical protein